MNKNICRFTPSRGGESEINVLNFVYETTHQSKNEAKRETTYKIHLITKGRGRLYFGGIAYDLKCGDLFFTFPSAEYSIQSGKNFEYMYISFIGIRSNKLLDKLRISKNNFLFRNQKKLIPIWKQSIAENKYVLGLRCEGILLYSFSVLSEQDAESIDGHGTLTKRIKKYLDEHFTDEDLSLKRIGSVFSYNEKYVSATFKKEFHIGITQYIKTLRIQYACTLMEYGFSSVNDIARRCGFSDPLYFSKVFKEKMGISPKEHMKQIKKTK